MNSIVLLMISRERSLLSKTVAHDDHKQQKQSERAFVTADHRSISWLKSTVWGLAILSKLFKKNSLSKNFWP